MDSFGSGRVFCGGDANTSSRSRSRPKKSAPIDRGRLNRLDEAEQLLREFNAAMRTDLGSNLLGECLLARGRFAEAEPLLLQSTPPLLTALKTNRVKAADIARKVERLYASWGKPDEAEPWRLKALDLGFPADPFAKSTTDPGHDKP